MNQIEREESRTQDENFLSLLMQWLAFEMRFLLENCWIVTMKNLHFCIQKFISISSWKSFSLNASFDNWNYSPKYVPTLFSPWCRKIQAKSLVLFYFLMTWVLYTEISSWKVNFCIFLLMSLSWQKIANHLCLLISV